MRVLFNMTNMISTDLLGFFQITDFVSPKPLEHSYLEGVKTATIPVLQSEAVFSLLGWRAYFDIEVIHLLQSDGVSILRL